LRQQNCTRLRRSSNKPNGNWRTPGSTPRVSGRVAFDKSKVNQQLRPGEAFLRIVGKPWVLANLNRRQLKHLKPGQRVRTWITGIKERTFPGRVEKRLGSGVTRAGAAERMPLPKLVRRLFSQLKIVPVRIALDPEGLRGFEDRMDPGLASSVEAVAE